MSSSVSYIAIFSGMLSYSSYRGNISNTLVHAVIDDAGIKCSGGGMIYATVESDAICV